MKPRAGRAQSPLVAAGLLALLTLWMLSGQIGGTEKPPATPQATEDARGGPMRVRVREFTALPMIREIRASGRTEPARAVTLRAEIDARVIEVGAERGARVSAGDVIVRLDLRDREAALAEARAAVRQRDLQYQAALKLEGRNFQSQTQVAESLANLEAARAALRRIQVEIDNASVRAPFAGVLESRPVEIGDYVSDGAEVARIIEQDPLVVVADVAQQEVHQIRPGMPGEARLVTGQTVRGVVRFVASEADAATRTFRVEVEVANPGATLVSGITSEVRIPVEELSAHRLSPALLSLDEANRLGVKAVDGQDMVRFHAVRVVRSEAEGVWVAGLPETVRLITVGQGFVLPGEHVVPVPEDSIAADPLDPDASPAADAARDGPA